jgi:hypothetical protein
MTAPFTHKPLERPSFFLRLFGRQPKINGLIEMNNLLAQAEGASSRDTEKSRESPLHGGPFRELAFQNRQYV